MDGGVDSKSHNRVLRIPGRRLAAAFCCLVCVAGCTTPEFVQPPTVRAIEAAGAYRADGIEPIPSGTREASAVDTAAGLTDASPVDSAELDRWWRAIGGDELDELVRGLLVQSLDLEIARARIAQADALRRQAGGARLPGVDASLNVQEVRGQGDEFGAIPGGPGGGAGGFTSFGVDSYAAALNVNWDVDLFGELRRAARAAGLSLAATRLRETATAQALVAELTRAWVGLATLQRRVELQLSIADSFRTTAELTDQRYRNGSETTSAADVEIARANLAAAEARLPELRFQLGRQAIGVDLLLGRLPGETLGALDAIELPEVLDSPPVGMPAALLTRRPDVAAAELEFRAALEDVGAARARLFPALSLTSSLTFRGQDSGALDWDNYLALLAGSLVAPIFQRGQLRAQVSASEAAARELAASYSTTALGAVADVETALLAESAYAAQSDRLEENVRAAELANELSQNRYRQGLSSLLSVLEAQRSLNTARENLILAEQARFESRIDLYLALGGDWAPDDESL